MPMDERTRQALLALYDVPDPAGEGMLPGYDRDHAERTTRIVLPLTSRLGLDSSWEPDLEAACLLHDIGRAGMDPRLFGLVFGLAQERGLPVRLKELLARYPAVAAPQATAVFLKLLGPALEERGIALDERLTEHVRMRMDFKGRVREVLAAREGTLRALGVAVKPWMEKVILYYYYPEGMAGERAKVRLMGMALVACENFEAFNNRRRGRDYYGRDQERLRDVFATLARFEHDGLVSARVMEALRSLTLSGDLDGIIKESREIPAGHPLPPDDLAYIEELRRA